MNPIKERKLKKARVDTRVFFHLLITVKFCEACFWGIKTLPRSPSLRGAVEMFCLWSLRVQENIVCRRLGRFGQAFFQTATASFRSAAVRITRTIVFGAQLRSRLRQIAGLRFTILELRFPLPSRCGREARSKRDAGTSHTRNSERLRERERSARNVAKSKELARVPALTF